MKSENTSVAAQYAEAVIQLASNEHVEEDVLRDLEVINNAVISSADLGIVLRHPSISATTKVELLMKLAKGKLNKLTERLLKLLADKRRLDLLVRIEAEYRHRLRAQRNIVVGSLVAAESVNEQTISAIKQKLATILGKHIELEVKVDRSLIGGLLLRYGDQVIDGSLKGRLEAIEKLLLSL